MALIFPALILSNFMIILSITSLPKFTNSIPLRLELTHVDAGQNFSNLELMQRSMARTAILISRLVSKYDLGQASDVPLKYNSGEYIFDVAIGTPPKLHSLLIDTGSSLVWLQCTPCIQCEKEPIPLFNASSSSSYSLLPCSNKLCKALGDQHSTCQSKDLCIFSYGYADGASSIGIMGKETFTFGSFTKPVSIPMVGFGCTMYNQGKLFGSGVAGFSKGKLSVISQLQVKKFGYCFTPISSRKKSRLLFDELSDIEKIGHGKKIVSTPIINIPHKEYFYVSLKGITVGSARVPLPSSAFEYKGNGSGGVVVDSGTTYILLQSRIHEAVTQAFVSQIEVPIVKGISSFGFCLQAESKAGMPKLVFHFDGADLAVPVDNYFMEVEEGLHCLTIVDGSKTVPMNLLGNFMTQNMYVEYDLEHSKLSWVPAECENL